MVVRNAMEDFLVEHLTDEQVSGARCPDFNCEAD